jgi:CRISPR/Cas system-associated protein Csm6
MLTLFSSAAVRDGDALVQELAKEAARRTILQLSSAAANMNAAELRGYVRTRATAESTALVRSSIAKLGRSEDNAQLTAAVVERAVHLVVREMLVQPVGCLPIPHVQSRAA